jgi:hypothetical protein
MRPRPLKQDSAVIRATGFADLSVTTGEVFRQAKDAPTVYDLAKTSLKLQSDTLDQLTPAERANIFEQNNQRIEKVKRLQDDLMIETDDVRANQLRTELDDLVDDPFVTLDAEIEKMLGDGRLLNADALNEEYGDFIEFEELLVKNKRAEIARNAIIQKGLNGVAGYSALFGGSLVAAATDPIEIGAAFIPYFGLSTRAKAMARFGKIKGRTAIGAGEGFAGSVVTEPLYYGLSRQQQLDYTMGEALLNVGVGTFLGGGLGTIAGLFGKQKVNPASVARDVDLPDDALPAQIKDMPNVEVDQPQLDLQASRQRQNSAKTHKALGGEKVAGIALRQFLNDNAIDVTPVMPRHVNKPENLLAFIRRQGGINDNDPTSRGELKSMDIKGAKGYYDKRGNYVSRVSNPDGRSLDDMTMRAQEEGYIDPNIDTTSARNELLEKIRDEDSGNKFHFTAADQNEAADWENFVAGKNAYEAEIENRKAIKQQLDYLGVKHTDEEIAIIADRMSRTGEDVDEAHANISHQLEDLEAEYYARYALDPKNDIAGDFEAAQKFDDAFDAIDDEYNFDAEVQRNEEIIKQYQNANQLTAKELDEVEAEIARAEETYDAYVELVRTGTICMSRA